jgi:NitT/TauT family transport system substrate-binding protein
MTIVLQETLRAVFYAPFYAALALGAYADEGVEVRFVSAPCPSSAADALLDGSVDVTWGGPLRVISTRERRPDSDLVCFCEVVTRDPFVVVGRERRPGFNVADLVEGRRIATVAEVPTPWLCLQEDIRRRGADPADVWRITDRTMPEAVGMLRRGVVDAVQLFEPFVEELVHDGAGHIWYAAADRGQTSYTTLYARRGILAARRDEFRHMVRALYRIQKWIGDAGAAELARVVAGHFPAVPESRLVAALARYRTFGIWGRNPRLPRTGYERLLAGMLSGGFVRMATAYEEAVDNSLAEEVIREDPPPLIGPRL